MNYLILAAAIVQTGSQPITTYNIQTGEINVLTPISPGVYMENTTSQHAEDRRIRDAKRHAVPQTKRP